MNRNFEQDSEVILIMDTITVAPTILAKIMGPVMLLTVGETVQEEVPRTRKPLKIINLMILIPKNKFITNYKSKFQQMQSSEPIKYGGVASKSQGPVNFNDLIEKLIAESNREVEEPTEKAENDDVNMLTHSLKVFRGSIQQAACEEIQDSSLDLSEVLEYDFSEKEEFYSKNHEQMREEKVGGKESVPVFI